MHITALTSRKTRMTAGCQASLPRLLLLWIVLGAGGISCRAVELPAQPTEPLLAAAPAAEAAPAPAADDNRTAIIRPPFWLFARTISFDSRTQEFVADGDAEIRSPQGQFFADSIHYDFGKNTGYLEQARGDAPPFHFRAEALTLDAQNLKHIQDTTLTTCTQAHPHYALFARDFVVTPDNHFEARHVSLIFGGRRLFTLPRLAGNLSKDKGTSNKPPLLVGASRLDGVYIGTTYDYPLSKDADLLLSARVGTEKLLRGDLSLNRVFRLPGDLGGGKVSLRITEREDAQNRILQLGSNGNAEQLESLTISRLPAILVDLDPIPLKGDLHGFSVRAGASAGIYHEDPTAVTDHRAQFWTTLRTPARRVGNTLLSAEFGVQQAYYGASQHRIGISQLMLESRPEADHYFSLTYVLRGEDGRTPFLFDRVVLPQELSAAVELPVGGRGSNWRLGLTNRFDLEQDQSRDLGIQAIYREDCLSYALTYNTVGQTFGVGLVLNAFGNFRKQAGSIAFTE